MTKGQVTWILLVLKKRWFPGRQGRTTQDDLQSKLMTYWFTGLPTGIYRLQLVVVAENMENSYGKDRTTLMTIQKNHGIKHISCPSRLGFPKSKMLFMVVDCSWCHPPQAAVLSWGLWQIFPPFHKPCLAQSGDQQPSLWDLSSRKKPSRMQGLFFPVAKGPAGPSHWAKDHVPGILKF